MNRIIKAILLGLLTGVVGITIGLSRYGIHLEENFGLDFLFKLRGEIPAPTEVIHLSLDKHSADKLNISRDTRKWPRSFHADLINKLTQEGASVIAFDITFKDEREGDPLFAQAMKKAGNVILTEYMDKEIVPLEDASGQVTSQINIEKRIQPTPLLAQESAALTSFPLPKVPARVSQFWTFKDGSHDFPTTAVTAFQVHALQVHDNLADLLRKALNDPNIKTIMSNSPNPSLSAIAQNVVALKKEDILVNKKVHELIGHLRSLLGEEPSIAETMLNELEKMKETDLSLEKRNLLKALIRMYQSGDTHFLNFYGPAGTITRVPYYQAFQLPERVMVNKKVIDFKGKAVFVGVSEILAYEQKDGFYTAFSQSNGVDLSGVEIIATAFANLLEDRPILPISFPLHLLTLLLWGMAIGMVWFLLRPAIAILCTVGLILSFLLIAYIQFKGAGIWWPIITPLFFQAPLGGFLSVLWNFLDTSKDRKIIREALGYYLPNKEIAQLSKNIGSLKSGGQLVYGTILCTDVADYTTISEAMSPMELRTLMNEYYEVICAPVKKYNGIILDYKGDAMLAIWANAQADPSLKIQPCLAAPAISRAVEQFNRSSGRPKLHTRIGLHFGQMMLGNVGGGDRFDYTVVGDIVNAASRIEGLNKYVGTTVLASEAALANTGDFLTRDLGAFALVGKAKSLVVHEIMGQAADFSADHKNRFDRFSAALRLYKTQQWSEAIEQFREILKEDEADGPSLFYMDLCKKLMENPPPPEWDGVVKLDKK